MGLWNGSGISWTICKQSAPGSRQITTPTPRRSIFTGRVLFLTPNRQCQCTEDKLIREDSSEYLCLCRNMLSVVHSPVVFCHNDLQEGTYCSVCSSADFSSRIWGQYSCSYWFGLLHCLFHLRMLSEILSTSVGQFSAYVCLASLPARCWFGNRKAFS